MTHDLYTPEGVTSLMASSRSHAEWVSNAIAVRDHNRWHIVADWWYKYVLYTEAQFVKDYRYHCERVGRIVAREKTLTAALYPAQTHGTP